jgi:menaquinone-dependent protoporphyrinogen IX oxidase
LADAGYLDARYIHSKSKYGGNKMKRTLIAYVSHSGSTKEIAEFMGRELSSQGIDVDVRLISEIKDINPYETIIAGGLLYRFGWHPEVLQFLKRELTVLKTKRVGIFVVGLRLVKTPDCDQQAFPVFIDPAIMKPAEKAQKKGLMDSYTMMKRYLGSALPTIEEIHPISLAFLAGKLNLNTLGTSEKLIMRLLMLLMDKKQGDYRNWEYIRKWVNTLVPAEVKKSEHIKTSQFEHV